MQSPISGRTPRILNDSSDSVCSISFTTLCVAVRQGSDATWDFLYNVSCEDDAAEDHADPVVSDRSACGNRRSASVWVRTRCESGSRVFEDTSECERLAGNTPGWISSGRHGRNAHPLVARAGVSVEE